jgi:subfamily B ATP-binding cassette protein MsbA
MLETMDAFRNLIRHLSAATEATDAAAVAAAPMVSLGETIRRFWPDARPYLRWLLPTLLLVAIGPAIDTVTIGLYGRLVDQVLVPRDLQPFVAIAGLYLGLTLLDGLVGAADTYLSAWVGERFLLDLRTRLFAHLLALPPHVLERQRLGDIVLRLTADVGEIEELLLASVVDAAAYLLRIVFFTVALFALQWQLAGLALIVAPLFWLVARVFGDRIARTTRDQRRHVAGIGAVAEEILANTPLVQAYNRQQTELARFRREAEGSFAAEMARTRSAALFAPLIDLIQLGGVLTIVAAGTWQLTQGRMSLGGLLAFVAYLNQLYDPVRGLSQLLTTVAAARAGAERVAELLDQPVLAPTRQHVAPLPPAMGTIAFERVAFRYPESERATLEDVSFRVAPGETVALVGASGAGKSTIVKLVLGFLEPSAGRILVDGHDLRGMDIHSVRERIAVVLQETLAFHGTVRENIAYGRADATEREIELAARATGAHDFIVAQPQGYDTVIGSRGARLSRGQRQRLAMARAMVRNAPILILDEPTTGLDGAARERLREPLRHLMRERATIVVSHDPAMVREATTIVVLDAGRIVERGAHAELVRRQGVYARLFHYSDPVLATVPHGAVRVPSLAGKT